MTKVSDILYAAYRLAGVLTAPGRGYSDDELADGINALNSMLESWSIDPLQIYTFNIDSRPLVAGQQTYTIGVDPSGLTTADFSLPRPTKIESANVIVDGGIRYPIQLLNDAQWAAIRLQRVGPSWPTKLYNDGAFPFSTLYLWPIPASGYSLELYTWAALPQFSAPTDIVSLPPGYRRAIEYNLALELAARTPRAQLTPLVQQIATESKAAVLSLNAPSPLMSADPAVFGGTARDSAFNWMTGNLF